MIRATIHLFCLLILFSNCGGKLNLAMDKAEYIPIDGKKEKAINTKCGKFDLSLVEGTRTSDLIFKLDNFESLGKIFPANTIIQVDGQEVGYTIWVNGNQFEGHTDSIIKLKNNSVLSYGFRLPKKFTEVNRFGIISSPFISMEKDTCGFGPIQIPNEKAKE